MLNRYQFNGGRFGGGERTLLEFASGAQSFLLVGVGNGTARKYGRAEQEFLLTSYLVSANKVVFSSAQDMTLSGTGDFRVVTNIHGDARGRLVLDVAAAGFVRRAFLGAASLALGGEAEGTVWKAVPFSASQVFSLLYSASGEDLWTGRAPEERTIRVPAENRIVFVPATTEVVEV